MCIGDYVEIISGIEFEMGLEDVGFEFKKGDEV